MKNPINKSKNKSKKKGKNKDNKKGKNKKFSLKACQKKFVGGRKFTTANEITEWIAHMGIHLNPVNIQYSGWVIRRSEANDKKANTEFKEITASLFPKFSLDYFTLYNVGSNGCLIVIHSHDPSKNDEAMPSTLEKYYLPDKMLQNNLVITGYIDVQHVNYILTTDKSKYEWLAIEGTEEIYLFMPIKMGEALPANISWENFINHELSNEKIEAFIQEDQMQNAFASWYDIIQLNLGNLSTEEAKEDRENAERTLQEWQENKDTIGVDPVIKPPPGLETGKDKIYDIYGKEIPDFGFSHIDLGMIYEMQSGYFNQKTAYSLVTNNTYDKLYFLKENSRGSLVIIIELQKNFCQKIKLLLQKCGILVSYQIKCMLLNQRQMIII